MNKTSHTGDGPEPVLSAEDTELLRAARANFERLKASGGFTTDAELKAKQEGPVGEPFANEASDPSIK